MFAIPSGVDTRDCMPVYTRNYNNFLGCFGAIGVLRTHNLRGLCAKEMQIYSPTHVQNCDTVVIQHQKALCIHKARKHSIGNNFYGFLSLLFLIPAGLFGYFFILPNLNANTYFLLLLAVFFGFSGIGLLIEFYRTDIVWIYSL